MNKPLYVILLLLWFFGVVWGAHTILVYENTPAQVSDSPQLWPTGSRLMRATDRFTLLMLAHPNCPCTRASLAELEIIMATSRGKATAFVVFSKPNATATQVHESPLWKIATGIPDVLPVFDDQGVESRRFNGEVSGQTMLYDPRGHLVFSGGITSARGHQGDNEGADAVVRIIATNSAETHRSSVFGCAIHNPSTNVLREDPSWKR